MRCKLAPQVRIRVSNVNLLLNIVKVANILKWIKVKFISMDWNSSKRTLYSRLLARTSRTMWRCAVRERVDSLSRLFSVKVGSRLTFFFFDGTFLWNKDKTTMMIWCVHWKCFGVLNSPFCNTVIHSQVSCEQTESGESITEPFGTTQRFRVMLCWGCEWFSEQTLFKIYFKCSSGQTRFN